MHRKLSLRWFVVAAIAVAACALGVSAAHAALTPYDAPTVSCVSSGQSAIWIKVCAGASGAPAGVTVQWETKAIYDQFGWLSSDDPRLCALSLSGQPSYQHPGASRWDLGSNACQTIEIGDINFDETGVSGSNCGTSPLVCGTEYVFRTFAHAGRGFGRSDWSSDVTCATEACPNNSCTLTQGYWKTHGPGTCVTGNNQNEWPASALPMLLGNVSYNAGQLCAILSEQPGNGGADFGCTHVEYHCGNANGPLCTSNSDCNGNKTCGAYNVANWSGSDGLITLVHQLIAAKLNIAKGATCTAVTPYITQADALIGNLVVPGSGLANACGYLDPTAVSSLVSSLDSFNNGILNGCPAHCAGTTTDSGVQPGGSYTPNQVTPAKNKSWGELKSIYR